MAFCLKFCCSTASDRKETGKKGGSWRIFSLKELHSATNNFNYDNKLGEGGFGSVYWGQLWDGSQFPGYYCASFASILLEKDKSNLPVAAFSSSVALDPATSIVSSASFSSSTKLSSSPCYTHIIHRDIKASNVLLDSDFKAQVADFGFAKLIPDGATHVTTRVKGTLGYLAPEYAMFGKASESCDVYSFGILLLELVSGKKPIEKLSATMKRTVVDWALPLVREREFDEVADPKLNGKYVGEELRRVVLVALLCAQSRPEMRPTMHEAVDMLKGESKEVVLNLENHELFRQDQAGSCQEGAYEFISEEKDPKQDLNEAAAAGSVVS